MHDDAVRNPDAASNPAGSVRDAADGSLAAIVPARRAMSWHLSDAAKTPVVRERYWVTFQPGEIRVCASCHGLNTVDQLGRGAPVNPPEALREMLRHYKTNLRPLPGRKRPVRR
jgi:mono/diheme cytochrome c family protein